MKKIDKIFITGIGTEVWKTIVSAIFAQALKADYWKHIQCGGLQSGETSEYHFKKRKDSSVFYF